MPERGRYMISVAADLAGLHPQTLRMYEARRLVTPARTPGGTRLYSDADVERLRLIQRLTTELGLNLAGVQHVLRLEDELRRLRARMRAARARAARRDPADPPAVPARGCALRQAAATGTRTLTEETNTMDFEKLTIKSGEAVAAAQELARRAGNPELTPDHLTVALLDQELPRTLCERAGASAGTLRAEAEARLRAAAFGLRRERTAAGVGGAPPSAFDVRSTRSESTRRRVRLGRASAARARPRPPRCAARRAQGGARRPAGDVAGSRGLVPGAREVRP